ncbi:hypothetical protein RHMOL_Rhmol02G0242100 [Rhododendron molle]|uniref:Uncharacterized protein n=1 Tax=Rhododendron molle TaxID=49168 RepID=A0ACC0PU06_RHOML|nr:hypothetical protein RHMOL_Rhmol02G0242100 [Rhododendron molle]
MCTKTFEQIGGIWGHFIKVDEATLKDLALEKGRILIATEEIQPVNRWIQMEVEGIVYNVKVSEDSTFVNPDEVETFVGTRFQKISSTEDAMEMAAKAGEEDDDDVERPVVKVTNRNEVVGEGQVTSYQ